VARKEGRLPGTGAGADVRGEADAVPVSVKGKKIKKSSAKKMAEEKTSGKKDGSDL
jgi:hypothetical protein